MMRALTTGGDKFDIGASEMNLREYGTRMNTATAVQIATERRLAMGFIDGLSARISGVLREYRKHSLIHPQASISKLRMDNIGEKINRSTIISEVGS